jgi:hypothetical protein
MKRVYLSAFAFALAFSSSLQTAPAYAQQALSPVQEFDPQAFPGQVVDDVVVPVPSEVFSVLDKLGEPNWNQEIRKLNVPKTSNRTELSLLFGHVVAEGFVAVQAEDKEAIKDIGREVIDLATALGLIKSVRPHAQAILDEADKGNWTAIRREFDQTQQTVRDSMEQMKDADLSQCVSLGGWLRGTASVTSVIQKNFTADRAELLNQTMIVEHFISSIDKMSSSSKEHGTVTKISQGLKDILHRMEGAVDGFSADAVAAIGKECEDLLKQMHGASH